MGWETFQAKLLTWASRRRDVVAVAVCAPQPAGARGVAPLIELVVVATFRDRLVHDRAWLLEVGAPPHPEVNKRGVVRSLRSSTAVGDVAWHIVDAKRLAPGLDPDARALLLPGTRVLHDPRDLLFRVLAADEPLTTRATSNPARD